MGIKLHQHVFRHVWYCTCQPGDRGCAGVLCGGLGNDHWMRLQIDNLLKQVPDISLKRQVLELGGGVEMFEKRVEKV